MPGGFLYLLFYFLSPLRAHRGLRAMLSSAAVGGNFADFQDRGGSESRTEVTEDTEGTLEEQK